jgi:hypothetical protein
MFWLNADAPLTVELIHGLRDRTFWRVELYRPGEKEPYQAGYTADPAEARAIIPQMMQKRDFVRVIAPRNASHADIQALQELGAVLETV